MAHSAPAVAPPLHRQAASPLETTIEFGAYHYQYVGAAGTVAWSRLDQVLADLEADRLVIVTERSIPADIVDQVVAHASDVAPTAVLRFSGGESVKTLATLDELAGAALTQGASRRSCIVAVGGGLVGNIAGLLAALLFRGIRLVHIPTTLLGMSDSVLSLKQAVNSAAGKNHLGTFHAPVVVWSNVDFLERLPRAERQAALCEVVKNVVAIRPSDHGEVAAILNPAAEFSAREYLRLIELTIEQKSSVMADDAHERADALVLEYGHTVGHALEVVMNGALTHGLAIGVGMTVAAEAARTLGIGSERVQATILELLSKLGAPTLIPADVDPTALMARVRLDNKHGYLKQRARHHAMVLLEDLGQPATTDDKPLTAVPDAVIAAAIKARQGRSAGARSRITLAAPGFEALRVRSGTGGSVAGERGDRQ
jgi:3-dehydroquinate synthase/2-deoxy-scyllo-inosose synthase